MIIALLIILILELAAVGWYVGFKLDQFMEYQQFTHNAVIKRIDQTRPQAGVTDPFKAANKSHVVGASSKHIIVRKTPDQIRAENYEEIKKGGQYGHHS